MADGLLTGVCEGGITLLFVLSSRLRTAGWATAVTFGTAFGCFEAVVVSIDMIQAGLVVKQARFEAC